MSHHMRTVLFSLNSFKYTCFNRYVTVNVTEHHMKRCQWEVCCVVSIHSTDEKVSLALHISMVTGDGRLRERVVSKQVADTPILQRSTQCPFMVCTVV